MEADLPAVFLHAHQAINIMCTKQMAVLGIAETALRAMKLPKGLSDHGGEPPTLILSWKAASESRKGDWMCHGEGSSRHHQGGATFKGSEYQIGAIRYVRQSGRDDAESPKVSNDAR
jgi:hypothetical protein